jgi:hypothetical protein
MASPARDSLPKRGRPKLGISIKRIGLQANIYDEWIAKKKDFGFAQKSNSDFAKYLLRISDEHRGQTSPSTVGEFISDIFQRRFQVYRNRYKVYCCFVPIPF